MITFKRYLQAFTNIRSGAGGCTRCGGGAGAIVGFKIIRDSCRGIQGPSASKGGLITRRVVCITLSQNGADSGLGSGSFLADSGAGLGGGIIGFGIGVSLNTILIRQYSIKAMNTNTVQTDINASTAFRYETGGRDDCDFACCVDKVSNDVTPSVTRAGAASGFIQNETHDIITIIHVASCSHLT
uniref:Uncharacterized protein n=1 Tax=Glossina brevipalpis TaxID=37001 RepID=A0A1A9WRN4_9MUSC